MNLTDLANLSTKRLEALQSEGVHSAEDLLNFFPRRYLDRSNTQKMKVLPGSGEEVTVAGEVVSVNMVGYGNKKRLEGTLNDGTG
ncbi:MAG TPA: ATP-dependent DNA helicase RecG, partial [Balneolaceae bacterium]|nr:ATP-dependent DNA helicase RecG [Balneolaceae bacterium]